MNHLIKFKFRSSQLFTLIQNVCKRSFAAETDKEYLIKNICLTLSCNKQTALTLYNKFPRIRSIKSINRITPNIELLLENGVSEESIGGNQFLLISHIAVLKRKLQSIKRMEPNNIDDFIPLLAMKVETLQKVAVMATAERDVIPEKSRIYYFSKQLQVEPVTVSKYCSKFELIFFTDFNGIKKKLNILQDYNVDSEQILQSLYVFLSSEQVFISRIEEMSSNDLYNIKLFKRTDEQFNKVLIDKIQNKNSQPVPIGHKFKKTNLEKLIIMKQLNDMLYCKDKVSAQIYYSFIDTFEKLEIAKENLRFLISQEVSLECIKENTVVLTLPFAQIEENIKIIKEMLPNSLDDFLPLIEATTSELNVFRKEMEERVSKLPEANPIYYFCKNLNISPTIVSKYFVKHSDVFFRDFSRLQKKLDLLLAFHVQPLSILKSPNTFHLSLETLDMKLMKFKSQGIENISSWMLVCENSRMERIAARRVEEKVALGESVNVIDYLSKRLNWDDAVREKAIRCYPPLIHCSVLKVKGHLDYLLNETHFSIEDINSTASVFRTNLAELKQRSNELSAAGLIPRKLYKLCLSREGYLKMVEKLSKKSKCAVKLEQFKTIEKRIKEI